ncbi:MAG: hypothetical protein CMC51_00105 [Flavobacteriaceae bacterium]|nr:hypothetical protein [Flavobacteriaceae bacterium]
MLQRIQSLYLLFASIFFFIYWFFGLEWYKNGFKIIEENISSAFIINSPSIELLLNVTSNLPLIIVLISCLSIFLYKSRIRQILLCKISLYLSIYMCLFTIFYFYFTLTELIDLMPSKLLEFLLYAAILNPFICTFLIYQAINSIKKDIELINSLERIR